MAPADSTTGPTVSLADIARLVGQWCARTDPALLSGAQAAEGVRVLAPMLRQLSAKQAGLGERVEQCHSHDKQSSSTVDWMARLNGSTIGEAKQAIDTARRMKQCPTTSASFESGDLSVGQAALISSAAVVDPSAEADLVAHAVKTRDLAATRERADRVTCLARHGEDPEVRRARVRAKRRWSEFADGEMAGVSARFVREELAAMVPVIDAYADAQYQAARRRGDRDPATAYRADGVLAALAAAGAAVGITPPTRTEPPASSSPSKDATEAAGPAEVRPKKVKWNVTVLVDGIALKRGYAGRGETCEIPGIGPVEVDWVRRILPEALVDVLVHDLQDIRAHATTTRYRRRAINVTLDARDKRCVVPGCKRQRRLEADHRHDYAKGGPTSSANLGLLCDEHHDEKTYRGGRLERTATEWLWYPPPPAAGEPEPPPGSIPWRAPIGEHLTAFDLHDLPDDQPGEKLPFAS